MLSFAVRKILNDISAEADVDDLCTLADAENRLPFVRESSAQRKLRHVKLLIDVPRSVHFLMEENRINVIAARQNQCVVFLDALRNFAGVDAFRAEVRHGLDVVGCVKICNQNLHNTESPFSYCRLYIKLQAKIHSGISPAAHPWAVSHFNL